MTKGYCVLSHSRGLCLSRYYYTTILIVEDSYMGSVSVLKELRHHIQGWFRTHG